MYEQVGSAALTYGPKVLGGLYALDIGSRVTQGGTDFRAGSIVSRAAPIMVLETAPMTFGAMVGYAAPGKAYRSIKSIEQGYQTALLKGTQIPERQALGFVKGTVEPSTTGRFDYFVRQPLQRAASPLTKATIEYSAFRAAPSEGGYGFGRAKSALKVLEFESGMARTPAPEPTTIPVRTVTRDVFEPSIFESGGRLKPTEEFTFEPNVNQKAYGKPWNFGTGEIAPEATTLPISGDIYAVRTTRTPFTTVERTMPVEELAYGRQPSMADRLYRITMRGEQVEVPRKFFTEKTQYKLGEEAYPDQFYFQRAKARVQYELSPQGRALSQFRLTRPVGEIQRINRISALEARGRINYGTGTPATSPTSANAPVFHGYRGGSRITGTKVIGGREVPALAKEPSGTRGGVDSGKGLQSLQEPKIGYRQDYRGKVTGSMKPFTKMAGAEAIMTEPLPGTEPAQAAPTARTSPMVMFRPQLPQAQPTIEESFEEAVPRFSTVEQLQMTASMTGIASLVRPRQVFAQEPVVSVMQDIQQEQRQEILVSPMQDIMQRQGLRQTRFEMQMPDQRIRQMEMQTPDQRIEILPRQDIVPRQDIRFRQDIVPDQRLDIFEDIVTRQDITQTPEQTITQTPGTDLTYRYRYDYPIVPPDVPPTFPGGGGWFPGGGGGDGGRWRGERSWTVKNPVGADLLAGTRGSLPEFGKMKGIKMKKMKGMKGFKPMRF